MYLEHFGLIETPFGITPDTSFALATRSHQEALNTLLLALGSGEGFVKITGEVGTGKTLLCRRLLQALPARSLSAYLPNPLLSPCTLLQALAEELGLAVTAGGDEYRLLQEINRSLLQIAASERQVVVCIDEVQAMPGETLEFLRLLSNLETEKRKLMQIVLFGQPELDERLHQASMRQLLQRIAFHFRLQGLSRQEVGPYLAHRLQVAGHRGEALFSPRAVRALHRASAGSPRLVNILAHKALLAVFGEGGRQAGLAHVRGAATDTEGAKWPGWW